MSKERSRDFDVVIVGAGIAGCTAGILLAQQGARVALLDKRNEAGDFKRNCTHVIQPGAWSTLQRLGLAEPALAAGGVREPVELYTRWGWISPPPTRDPLGDHSVFNLRREKLDPVMRSLADSTAGLELMMGTRVGGLLRDHNQIRGVYGRLRDGTNVEFEAPLTVAADGRASTLALEAGVAVKQSPNVRFTYWAYYESLSIRPDRSLMWMVMPYPGFIGHTDEGLALVGVWGNKEALPEFKRDLEGCFERVFEGLPKAPSFAGARRRSAILGRVDTPNIWRRSTAPGLALIGDAAFASDSLFASGCGFAFQSGELLADCLGEAVADGDRIDKSLRRYRRDHSRMLRGHHFMISSFSKGRDFNFPERLLMKAATTDVESARRIHDLAGRRARLTEAVSAAGLSRAALVDSLAGRLYR